MQYAIIYVLLMILGQQLPATIVAQLTVIELGVYSLNLFFFAILIRIILSWVAPQSYNPISAIAGSLAEPVLRPFRRLIPPIGGLDISPIFAVVLLQASVILLQSLKPFGV